MTVFLSLSLDGVTKTVNSLVGSFVRELGVVATATGRDIPNTEMSRRALSDIVFHLPFQTNVFKLGSVNPILRNVDFSMREGESWAVIGSKKVDLLDTILGHNRVYPPPPSGLFPFLSQYNPPRDPHTSVSLVSFAYRMPAASSGAFYDYTARYGAVREEDRITLRQSISTHPLTGDPIDSAFIENLSSRLQIQHLLDLPLVALSNGQTRRATIMKELLRKPDVLVLDEPLTGLDVKQRPLIMELLRDFHSQRDPRIILGLREQDPLPDWVSHIAVVQSESIVSGPKGSINSASPTDKPPSMTRNLGSPKSTTESSGRPLVEIKGLNIAYHDRKVLSNIDWTVREGERWHLSGPNGSGKTTLLSVLTGDHPQSYIQKHLTLFGKPRRSLATSQIQNRIGFVSPEIFNAFPRRHGPGALSVREAIATGFESTYSYRPISSEQELKIESLLDAFDLRGSSGLDLSQPFASLATGWQSLALLLRALVNSPPLIILDEVFAGMDSTTIEKSKKYLRERLSPSQAVIFVTHWEEELPWPASDVHRITLGDY